MKSLHLLKVLRLLLFLEENLVQNSASVMHFEEVCSVLGDALADCEHDGGGEEECDGDADREVDERLHLARVHAVLHRHDRLRRHYGRPKRRKGL